MNGDIRLTRSQRNFNTHDATLHTVDFNALSVQGVRVRVLRQGEHVVQLDTEKPRLVKARFKSLWEKQVKRAIKSICIRVHK